MNGPQPALSDPQVAAYARDAGFWGDNLITMVAVALAESGGDPDNVGDERLANKQWGPSYGLAQVRSLWADFRSGRARDAARLTDPAFNMRSAFAISSGGTNFGPWSTFTNRRYLGLVDRARAAVGQVGGKPKPLAAGDGPDINIPLPGGNSVGLGLPGAGDLLGGLIEPLTEGLARIVLVGLLVAGGAALITAGAYRATGMKDRADALRRQIIDTVSAE